jgi:hypothetical protein
MSNSKVRVKEDGTIAGCYDTRKPIWPNRCEDCAKHSDATCKDVRKNGKQSERGC